MKRLLLILGVVILVAGGLATPVFGAGSGEVDVTVTVAEPSITVNPTSVDYGLVNLNANMLAPLDDPRIMVHNVGNCFVDLYIKGADTTNWMLSDSAGNERYVHYWSQGPPDDLIFNPLALAYQDFDGTASMSPSSLMAFNLRMDTPTQSAHFGQQSTTVTVMAIMVTYGITLELNIAPETYPPAGGTAHLTATVRDQNDQLVSGIPVDRFRVLILGIPGMQPVTWSETGTGVYEGDLTIPSGLLDGNYMVRVSTRADLAEGTMLGSGFTDFDIVTP